MINTPQALVQLHSKIIKNNFCKILFKKNNSTNAKERGDSMSLTTLTFANANAERATQIGVGKVRVMKTDKFFGINEICVIGKLVEGAVANNMRVQGRSAFVRSVESNYGEDYCVKEGAQVVIMVSGISKEEYNSGDEIRFETTPSEEIARPKGKFIIA